MIQKDDYFKNVAEKLIEQLKAGTAPWQKPWDSSKSVGLPYNPVSGTRYKGGNTIVLLSEAIDKGYADHRWMTYQQAQSAGGQVRKGEKGTVLRFYKFTEEVAVKDANGWPVMGADGKPKMVEVKLKQPKTFSFVVFNAAQIDNLKIEEPTRDLKTFEVNARAEKIFKASGAKISHGGDRAFYRGATDEIRLPRMEDFRNESGYYATALHELGHWTGHPSRLNRDMQHPFGSEGYAKEELRAEIYSMMMGSELGINHDPSQHASYVQSWIKVLQEDHREIFRAAADAEKMVSHVLEIERKHDLSIQTEKRPDDLFLIIAPRDGIHDLPVLLSQELLRLDAAQEKLKEARANNPGEIYRMIHVDSLPLALRNDFDAKDGNNLLNEAEKKIWNLYKAHKEFTARISKEDASVLIRTVDKSQVIVSPPSSYDRLVELSDEASKVEKNASFSISRIRDLAPQLVASAIDGNLRAPDETVSAILEMHAKDKGVVNKAPTQLDGDSFVLLAEKNGKQTLASPALYSYPAALRDVEVSKVLGAKETIVHFKDLPKEIVSQIESGEAVMWEAAKAEVLSYYKGQTAKAEKSAEVVLLDIPKEEREEAKALGAKWDRKARSWFITGEHDKDKFSKWIKEEKKEQVAETPRTISPIGQTPGVIAPAAGEAFPSVASEKTFLAVPYGQHHEAKKLGAKWDKEAKSWYCPAGEDLAKFSKWSDTKAPDVPQISPTQEFTEALKAAGLVIEGAPIMDGKLHRVSVEGGAPGNRDGAYIGHLDGHPAGYIQNFRSGTRDTWKSKGYSLSDKDKAKLQAEAAKTLEARQKERLLAYENVAEKASEHLKFIGQPSSFQPHPYLKNKEVEAHGIRLDKSNNALCVPAFDADGKIWSYQRIFEDGQKQFTPGGKMAGCMYITGAGMGSGASLQSILSSDRILIAEGFATAATLSEATGKPVVVAFSSGNLEDVAKSIRDRSPKAEIVICGDDDRGTKEKTGVNPGREKAERAAKAVGGMTIFPIFPADESKATDFNDLQKIIGKEGVKDQVQALLSLARKYDAPQKQMIIQKRDVSQAREVQL